MDSSGESLFSNSFYDFNYSSSYDELIYNFEPLVIQDIFTAANIGNKETVYNLISNKPYLVSAKNKHGWNALMYATYYNHQEIVVFLLEKNAPLHACNEQGQNILMIAASTGYHNLVEQFLNLGSNIESRDEKGFTPLLCAVNYNYLKVVQVLLKYGANPNALMKETGRTPLITAAYNGNYHLVNMLLNAGAYLDFKDHCGKSALSYAIEIGDKNVIAVLENFCSKVKCVDCLRTGPEEENETNFPYKITTVNSLKNEPAVSSSPSLESVLVHCGLGCYIPLFQRNAIDLVMFLGLSDKDLKECGVSELGSRRKMLDIISKWHHNNFYTKGSMTSSYELKLLTEVMELREQLSECKQERHDCESVIIELRRRLREVHERSYQFRDKFLQSLQLILPSISKVAEIFSQFFPYFDDFIHLTSDIGSDFHLRI